MRAQCYQVRDYQGWDGFCKNHQLDLSDSLVYMFKLMLNSLYTMTQKDPVDDSCKFNTHP